MKPISDLYITPAVCTCKGCGIGGIGPHYRCERCRADVAMLERMAEERKGKL